jgi:hypothetical protein
MLQMDSETYDFIRDSDIPLTDELKKKLLKAEEQHYKNGYKIKCYSVINKIIYEATNTCGNVPLKKEVSFKFPFTIKSNYFK